VCSELAPRIREAALTKRTGADAALALRRHISVGDADPGLLLKRLVICGALGGDQEQ
jgi:hypothetical protein